MSQRNQGRIDRFAQMSKQEEIIARKRQEILEKQRTAQLAKAVAAAQELAAKLKNNSFSGVSSGAVEGADGANGDTETKNNADIIEEEPKDLQNIKSKPIEQPIESPKTFNSFTGKTGKITFGLKRAQMAQPAVEQPPPKIVNTFCNDGSFLENFKKILEKHEQPKPQVVLPVTSTENELKTDLELNTDASHNNTTTSAATSVGVEQTGELPSTTTTTQLLQGQSSAQQQQQLLGTTVMASQQQSLQPPPPPTVVTTAPPPPPTAYAFNPNLLAQASAQLQLPAAFFHGGMPMQLHPGVAPPPPPPPPQLPIALANLTSIYMLPPEAMQLNAIPAPKEYDLNAIPKPALNLEAIQVPVTAATLHETNQQMQQQQQQLQQHQLMTAEQVKLAAAVPPPPPPPPPPPTQPPPVPPQEELDEQLNETVELRQQQQLSAQPQQDQQETFHNDNERNCIKLPTTLENLIAMVAENGEDYEDKIRSHKSDLQPAMWFLYDKNCDQYRNYRKQLYERQCYLRTLESNEGQGQQQQQQSSPAPPQQQQQQQNTLQEALNNARQDVQQLYKEPNENINIQPATSGGGGNNDTTLAPTAGTTVAVVSAADKYDPESVISGDIDSDDEYMRGMMDRNRDNIKRRIECRNELSEEERMEREAEAIAEQEREAQRQRRKRERKSRWGEKINELNELPTTSVATTFGNQNKPLLSSITRSDPALLQYARLNYGSVQLSEDDWKKCEEHFKVNLLYQDMMRKRQEIDRLARTGKFKYEYDSDEDVDGGTWEHKLRTAEMEATQLWATALTKQSEGKHHIGDFLPPEELKKFMEQYEAKKHNRQPDLSDYKEYKLKEDNIGFQMLQKLGWKEGQGLGTDGAGIVDPVNKAPQRDGNQGLGVSSVAEPEDCDNEYDAYRKRMMLAYRFRPNPLNNPRRAYY